MFGTKPKITDPSLYLLHDIAEEQLNSLSTQLTEIGNGDEDKAKEINHRIEHLKQEIYSFELEIQNQLKEKFQFSIEELYAMYGQYDKFISLEFHKLSDSAKTFGRKVSGIIIYDKPEREALDAIIQIEKVPRTNGFVKLDPSRDAELNDVTRRLIMETGFRSGDVYEVLKSDLPVQKAFNKAGLKEIPNTIEIKFDPTGFDPFQMELVLLNKRLENGGNLCLGERRKYTGLTLHYYSELYNLEMAHKDIYESPGVVYREVRFHELKPKLFNQSATKDELLEFNSLLKQRKTDRLELIRKEISRSTNRKLEQFEKEHPTIYEELIKSIYQFEEESFHFFKPNIPIYWNFESFLHIYLRHCAELTIEGHFENKTNFQYTQKDIKRVLSIAVENLLPDIMDRLNQGKDFRLYGHKALYFNGNHYSLHVLSDGRIAAFHPYENPNEE